MSNDTSRVSKPRSRTFTGCFACRARKVKCDLGRPDCANCQRLSLKCPGYGAVLSWMPAWVPHRADKSNKPCFDQLPSQWRPRAELLTEHDRQMESTKLLQHLGCAPECSDVGLLLDSLEQKATHEDGKLSHDFDFHVEVGPFTVFSTGNSSAADEPMNDLSSTVFSQSSLSADHGEPLAWMSDSLDFLYDPNPDCGPRQPSTNQISEAAIFHDGSKIMETQSPDLSGVPMYAHDPSVAVFLSSRISPQDGIEHAGSPRISNNTENTGNTNWPQTANQKLMPILSPTTGLSGGSPYLPPDLRFLLHHYDSQVIDSLSAVAIPYEKAPWRKLHLPSALRAFGELDVLGTSSLARVSLLYSLLSLTCYHLSTLYSPVDLINSDASLHSVPSAEHWKKQAQKYRGIGRTAFRKHLESQPTHKEKYKESLMAAMNLICVGVVSGDPWDARIYIRQCQNIIRQALGTKCHFSKRALQLHRIYAFITIVEQSTFCLPETEYVHYLENSDVPACEVNMARETPAKPDDLVAWCSVAPRADLAVPERLQLGPKPADEEGFYILFGASGKLIEMLSRTNTLINNKSASNTQYMEEDNLIREASILEQSICDWASESDEPPEMLGLVDLGNDTPFVFNETNDLLANDVASDGIVTLGNSMRVAFYNALLIYFFREVRNANPKILQHYVRKVIACVEYHQAMKAKYYPSKRIGTVVWPSFIAACEALSPALRHRAVLCIRHSATTGFRNGELAESVVREVWRCRDNGDSTVSWRDVVCQKKVIMVLS